MKNYKFDKQTNIIKNFDEKNNINYVNSFSVLKKYDEKDLWVTKLDPHANDLAHKIIADFLMEKLTKLIIKIDFHGPKSYLFPINKTLFYQI